MKKVFFSLVAATMAATATFAQTTLVATLSHDEDISMFYGAYALRDAMNASADGDVINLSGGAFQAVNITKAVALRGTGIDDAAPTYIQGDFSISLTEESPRLSMEGIRCTGTITLLGTWSNPYFLRCQFNSFSYPTGSAAANVKNAMFANCKITGQYILQNNSTVQFVNSYVNGFRNDSETTASASFINCLIKPYSNGYNPGYIKSSQLLNCIIFQTRYSSSNLGDILPSTTIASHCVSIGYNNLFSGTAASTNNKSVNCNEYAKVFKTFTGTYNDKETFELADEAKTTYLGTDGTEVGLYGGVLPYSATPSYPQITKMNVANRTTADGKLSVEIEVSAAE